jgi:hypothetical protein
MKYFLGFAPLFPQTWVLQIRVGLSQQDTAILKHIHLCCTPSFHTADPHQWKTDAWSLRFWQLLQTAVFGLEIKSFMLWKKTEPV